MGWEKKKSEGAKNSKVDIYMRVAREQSLPVVTSPGGGLLTTRENPSRPHPRCHDGDEALPLSFVAHQTAPPEPAAKRHHYKLRNYVKAIAFYYKMNPHTKAIH